MIQYKVYMYNSECTYNTFSLKTFPWGNADIEVDVWSYSNNMIRNEDIWNKVGLISTLEWDWDDLDMWIGDA